jgi:hypothetical protein
VYCNRASGEDRVHQSVGNGSYKSRTMKQQLNSANWAQLYRTGQCGVNKKLQQQGHDSVKGNITDTMKPRLSKCR